MLRVKHGLKWLSDNINGTYEVVDILLPDILRATSCLLRTGGCLLLQTLSTWSNNSPSITQHTTVAHKPSLPVSNFVILFRTWIVVEVLMNMKGIRRCWSVRYARLREGRNCYELQMNANEVKFYTNKDS